MSHFGLLLVTETNNESELNKAMEPYNEQTESLEYKEFVDETDKIQKAWEKETETRVKIGDKFFSLYDDSFRNKNWDFRDPTSEKFVYPEGHEQVGVPTSEVYSSIEEFADTHYGCHKNDDGKFGYLRNPNAKWDWWRLGGRWSGYLLSKSQEGDFDQLQMKDINWEGMADRNYQSCLGNYNKFQVIEAKYGAVPFWKETLDKYLEGEDKEKVKGDDSRIDAARDWYNNQPSVQAVRKELEWYFFSDDELREYKKPLEEFRELFNNKAKHIYAILKDGNWIERGEMGWFGMANNEKDVDVWADEANKEIDSIDPEHWVSIIDCHI